jgi:hypothetical protein
VAGRLVPGYRHPVAAPVVRVLNLVARRPTREILIHGTCGITPNKVVRLPEDVGPSAAYLDLWDHVRGAKTQREYLTQCRRAIASIYSGWKDDFEDWRKQGHLDFAWEPSPVLLVVADTAERADWLYGHLTRDFDLLRNQDGDDPRTRHTIRIDSKVFDADKGSEALLREGRQGATGEKVRCIVSVNMLSEGWDVKSVTHILGLRAFGSPLLTEQIIGRGLRRTSYDILNQPLEERSPESEETVDAFGIPFVGFPVERKKRQGGSRWQNKPVAIEPDPEKEGRRIRIPNVRSWAVTVSDPLEQLVTVETLPHVHVSEVSDVVMRPVVGENPKAIVPLKQWRAENPVMRAGQTL